MWRWLVNRRELGNARATRDGHGRCWGEGMHMSITVTLTLAAGEPFGPVELETIKRTIETGQDPRISFRYVIKRAIQ
jgi:hypothetical protein